MSRFTGRPASELYGACSVDEYFADNPKCGLPWPRAAAPRHGRLVSPEAVDALLSGPPHLVELDPRDLHATQNWVVAQHTRYYTTGVWERTGTTSADKHQLANRYPLVHVDHQGRHIVLAGHHRSLAALLAGRPVRARVLPDASAPTAVLPLLFIGPAGTTGDLERTLTTDDPHDAIHAIEHGASVCVCSAAVATEVMTGLGLNAATIEDRLAVAGIPRRARP